MRIHRRESACVPASINNDSINNINNNFSDNNIIIIDIHSINNINRNINNICSRQLTQTLLT